MSDTEVVALDAAGRQPWLASYIAGSRAFDHCLQADYPPGLLDWIPAIPGAWSVRSHLIHMMDAELFSYTRYRMAVAQPGAPVCLWDENSWEANLVYGKQSLTGSLQVFKLLRSLAYGHLQGLPPESWTMAAYLHPTMGLVNLDQWLQHYVRHTEEHLAYIKRNETAWRDGGIGAILPHGH